MNHEPKTAVYPGSFDPLTNGHLDVVDRAPRAAHDLGDLLGGYSAYPEALDKTLLLHFGEHAERLRYRTWFRCIEATDPQIDDIEFIETEVREIIMNGLAQLLDGWP